MTEQEWFLCKEPREMFEYLIGYATDDNIHYNRKISDRKLQLFGYVSCKTHSSMKPESIVHPINFIQSLFFGRCPDCLPIEIQVARLHDIAGNPFRPVSTNCTACGGTGGELYYEPGLLIDWCRLCNASGKVHWITPTVLSIAQRIYDEHDFLAMPILGDALEEAGCDNHDIRTHCEGCAVHVPGCWVVDLILGKE